MVKLEDLERALEEPRKRDEPVAVGALLSTGSTLLNMALSGHPQGGFPAGRYVFYVGDSSSGKTFFCLTCFAEAQLNPRFRDYALIYDNVEDGALMDFARYFGSRVAARVEPPARGKGGVAVNSAQIEDFYFHLDDRLTQAEKTGVPFIYVLDSMDALYSAYARKKFDEKKKASRGGTKAKGDYGDGKAKINSEYLRLALPRLAATGSILIVICQTRDNIDAGMFEPSKTRAGGHSLRFYAAAEVWTSAARLKRQVRGKERQVGIQVTVAVKKNRLTGKEWTVKVPLYWSYGIDDIGSCLGYLLDEGALKKNKEGRIDARPLLGDSEEYAGVYLADLARLVAARELEEVVRARVVEVWREVEAACQLDRPQRYT